MWISCKIRFWVQTTTKICILSITFQTLLHFRTHYFRGKLNGVPLDLTLPVSTCSGLMPRSIVSDGRKYNFVCAVHLSWYIELHRCFFCCSYVFAASLSDSVNYLNLPRRLGDIIMPFSRLKHANSKSPVLITTSSILLAWRVWDISDVLRTSLF